MKSQTNNKCCPFLSSQSTATKPSIIFFICMPDHTKKIVQYKKKNVYKFRRQELKNILPLGITLFHAFIIFFSNKKLCIGMCIM